MKKGFVFYHYTRENKDGDITFSYRLDRKIYSLNDLSNFSDAEGMSSNNYLMIKCYYALSKKNDVINPVRTRFHTKLFNKRMQSVFSRHNSLFEMLKDDD